MFNVLFKDEDGLYADTGVRAYVWVGNKEGLAVEMFESTSEGDALLFLMNADEANKILLEQLRTGMLDLRRYLYVCWDNDTGEFCSDDVDKGEQEDEVIT